MGAVTTIFFATYKLSESPAIWYDEGFYTQVPMYISTHGIQALQVAPNEFVSTEHVTVGYPLLYPVALSYRLFGNGVLQGRSVMVLYIGLFVLASYFLARKLFGAMSAVWVVLLLASFPMLYGNGKSVLGEVPGLFFLILTLLTLLYLERTKYRNVVAYGFVGLAAGLCVATKPIFILLLGALLVTYLVRWKKIPLQINGVAWGSTVLIIPIILWAYLQFGLGFSVQSVLAYYANPYSLGNMGQLILQNMLRFFTESTPIYTLFLMLVWTLALWIRRKKEEISSAELTAFFFCLFVLAAYMRLPGWYRYLFPALTVALIFLPASAIAVFSYLQEKLSNKISLTRFAWLPYAGIILLVCLQTYQTAADSYVAGYYTSTNVAHLSAVLQPLGPQASFFLYNVPQVAVLLPSQKYYQYLPVTEHLIIGGDQLNALAKGVADFVIVDSDTYRAHLELYTRYHQYKTVDRYEILQRNS